MQVTIISNIQSGENHEEKTPGVYLNAIGSALVGVALGPKILPTCQLVELLGLGLIHMAVKSTISFERRHGISLPL
ncbi:MAG: hypothetical protein GY820_40375 [Gammaproteobacteria bacterium]|nr:hypothetical protein [Gammaproteobacteria bacterium]